VAGPSSPQVHNFAIQDGIMLDRNAEAGAQGGEGFERVPVP
jgi:hypothetical protein